MKSDNLLILIIVFIVTLTLTALGIGRMKAEEIKKREIVFEGFLKGEFKNSLIKSFYCKANNLCYADLLDTRTGVSTSVVARCSTDQATGCQKRE